ncbi:hypothetical protein [Rhizobium sp. 007]|uniref:hypothetical protein n=1 Tax=Rhizobium sp. 007 TaxID=2785056 RepID=UPI0018907BAE|nr:hypothetical protein [Rhizobium sp. 007]QPB20683.1 hypothetical protein ISN39_04010 [Rhizobium sp. 007]
MLPNFADYPSRLPHGLGARLLVALLVCHGEAALYHQFIRSNGLLRQMWCGGRPHGVCRLADVFLFNGSKAAAVHLYHSQ